MKRLLELLKHFVFNILHVFVLGHTGSVYGKTGNTTRFTYWEQVRFKFSRQIVTRLNIGLLKLSGGRLGNSFLGMPVMLLTTIGRKSGKPRTLPIYGVEDGERYLLVGSNGGSPQDPLWMHNARANPRVVVERRGQRSEMLCRIASADEKARHWPRLTSLFPMWQEVQDRSGRDFPLAILEPVPATCENAGPITPRGLDAAQPVEQT